ncbi:histidine kinase [Sinomicrobium soli]|uniref:histidine kinase n=1 Tax=Sinomicrobium sp. N-1-3-6 TaxID=2219864 RepID=UPI000DCCF3C0|nr:histidine kinase [Sinomicrobium sp. N-1-3-6]RAV27465.1 hypothetical protein DN748_18510 [Sinomicrobium sp. N-1-3-6]
MKGSCILLIVFTLCGCNTEPDTGQLQQGYGISHMKEAEKEALQLDTPEQQVAYWKEKMTVGPFLNDTLLQSRVYYRLAGIYYTRNKLDSARWYMRKGWSLIENRSGADDMRVLFNFGEGNIATYEKNMHQANYYYSRAAAILKHAGSRRLELTPFQQAAIYLAVAQSDAGVYQYEQAILHNHEALRLLKSDTVINVRLLLRAYDQLAVDFLRLTEKQTDSARVYIERMDSLTGKYPGEVISPRFLFDRKALYYADIGKLDSSISYHRAILKMDSTAISEGETSPVVYGNLFKDLVNLSDRFVEKKQLDSALYYLNKSDQFLEEYDAYLSGNDRILYRENLANYFFASGQYDRANNEFRNVLEEARQVYENKYLQATAEIAAINELQVKEKSIIELNRQVVLKEGQLAENRLLLIITTLSALLAFTIIILLYGGRKQRRLQAEAERTRLQKNSAELEQRLLRAQMEPHFIFNTLASLQSYIRLDDKEKALKYLRQFSGLLRNSLELSRQSFVPLADELQTLSYYLKLQQMRYEEEFDFRIDHRSIEEDELYCWLIPPMLIQPFVENAIIHGQDNTKEERAIDIVISRGANDTYITATITDNGPGIYATMGGKKGGEKKKSLSTEISRERLKMLEYEKNEVFDISVTDRSTLPGNQCGTVVKLHIPVISA